MSHQGSGEKQPWRIMEVGRTNCGTSWKWGGPTVAHQGSEENQLWRIKEVGRNSLGASRKWGETALAHHGSSEEQHQGSREWRIKEVRRTN